MEQNKYICGVLQLTYHPYGQAISYCLHLIIVCDFGQHLDLQEDKYTSMSSLTC
jgi:hypothetical protein